MLGLIIDASRVSDTGTFTLILVKELSTNGSFSFQKMLQVQHLLVSTKLQDYAGLQKLNFYNQVVSSNAHKTSGCSEYTFSAYKFDGLDIFLLYPYYSRMKLIFRNPQFFITFIMISCHYEQQV
jgi:hypothetical protein